MDDELYDRWLDQYDIRDADGYLDDYAADMLYYGWFADDDEFPGGVDLDRLAIREEFYEYMDLESEDMDWEAWKEAMGYE